MRAIHMRTILMMNLPVSAMILAAASISNPNYVSEPYQVFLLTTFIMLLHGCISSMPTRWIANFNSVGSSFNILALFIVIIMIPSAATNRQDQGLPRFTPSKEVWGNIYNSTDFPAGLAILMTFVAVIWSMYQSISSTSLYGSARLNITLQQCPATTRPFTSPKNAPMPTSLLRVQ